MKSEIKFSCTYKILILFCIVKDDGGLVLKTD